MSAPATPALRSVLALNDDVVITPVSELPDDLRRDADAAPGDYAVSRSRGRGGSSIVDADSVQLLNRFRDPSTIVDAVIMFARSTGADATDVLEGAYPFLRGMLQKQVLIPAAIDGAPIAPSVPTWDVGTVLPVGTISRVLQRLDAGDVFQLRLPDGDLAVLKAHRESPAAASGRGTVTSPLAHEARVLAALNAGVAPTLLGHGVYDAHEYLLIEMLPGTDAGTVAMEWRDAPLPEQRREALHLARRVVAAYCELHAHGVLHGDVHPRNVFVMRDGRVRLIDFGLASGLAEQHAIPHLAERGGVPLYYDPQLAQASLDQVAPPPVTEASEQFSVAALLFSLITGEPWRRFRLGRREMLQDIVGGVPRRFVDCGVAPWPAMEQVLRRALSQDPDARWPRMVDFAAALGDVTVDVHLHGPSQAVATGVSDNEAALVALLHGDGPLYQSALPAPHSSVNYGAAGIALGALHAAQRYGSSTLLGIADTWLLRARDGEDDPNGFYNDEIEISRSLVGEASPYHTPSGIHAVDALVARASGNSARFDRAVQRFLICAARPAAGLDLTLGCASTLLGAAILHDAAPEASPQARDALRTFGDRTLHDMWRQLNRMQPVGGHDLAYVGIAHGWAGFLYATLQWCEVSGATVPVNVVERLDQIAELALPAGRGLEWPWVLGQPGEPPTMPGWCNGSCGYVFLFTLAHRVLGTARYAACAEGAAWNSWEAPDPAATLCCGLAGRAYALLNFARHTGDDIWVQRARQLGVRAMTGTGNAEVYPHALWKGALGVSVLTADLLEPTWARLPLFEPYGYRSPTGAVGTRPQREP